MASPGQDTATGAASSSALTAAARAVPARGVANALLPSATNLTASVELLLMVYEYSLESLHHELALHNAILMEIS